MARTVIIVHPDFDSIWPFAADHLHSLFLAQGDVEFQRLQHQDTRTLGELLQHHHEPERIQRLILLSVKVTPACTDALTGLEEVILSYGYGFGGRGNDVIEHLSQKGVLCYRQRSEGFWGESVSEFGLALTLCGLRRIPQLHGQIAQELAPWNFEPPGGKSAPGARGGQYGDDSRFTNGTVAGKKVRIVGAGNIASRYASFVHMLGADVAVWDPYASEPNFHRTGARREHYLDRLVQDADIFVPMVPLIDSTKGLVTAEHIRALPQGCLVVLVTRAGIVDMETLRQRVLADELSLAADVFDIEPLPLDDPLIGRHNVVHTPHIAGRTIHANKEWAELLFTQFLPR